MSPGSTSLYREKILSHYREPHNQGRVDDPDLSGRADNPNCGDELLFTAAVDDGRFAGLAFEGEGCALSVAAASLLTDALQDEPLDAADVPDDEMFGMLGLEKDEVSPLRVKCVLLARDGIVSMVTEHDA